MLRRSENVVPILYEACKYIGVQPDFYDPIEEDVKAYLRGINHGNKRAGDEGFNDSKIRVRADLSSKNGSYWFDLSCTDILVALYYRIMNVDAKDPQKQDRDQYIQSKGHAAEVLWAVLTDKGFLPKEELATFSQFVHD